MREFEELERFFSGCDRLPLCEQYDDTADFLPGQVSISIAIQFTAEYLWVQTKPIGQVLLKIASRTYSLAQIVTKRSSSTYTFQFVFLPDDITSAHHI